MDAAVPQELPAYDYVSPNLEVVRPDHAFPNMIVGDTRVPRWRWLRRWVEQNWYADRRNPDSGFTSRDEASILYNAALLVRGKPCLEIGCWRGWSAVHLALGSGMLDVIDPIIADPEFAESIRLSCEAAGVLDLITFHTGFSPAIVDALGYATGRKWSLIFVDGDHEGDAPRLDAEAAMRHAADTAMVLFHDLASPYVARGLDAMRNAGWRTMVYQTMQIMGVAWRGTIEPPDHTPDPNVFWTLPAHLAGYHVSGWKRPMTCPDGGWWPGMTLADRRDAAMLRAQAAEDAATASLADADAARRQAARLESELAQQAAKFESELAQQAAKFESELARQHASLRTLCEKSQQTLLVTAVWDEENTALAEIVRWVTGRRVLLGLLRRHQDDRFLVVRTRTGQAGIDALVPDEVLHRLLGRRMLAGLLRRPWQLREKIAGSAFADAVRRARSAGLASLRETLSGVASGDPILARLIEDADRGSKRPVLAAHSTADIRSVQTLAARVRESGLFDATFYEGQASIAGSATDLATHYVLVGDALGIKPSANFDPEYYAARNPDVAEHRFNRLIHYLDDGQREGRCPIPPGILHPTQRKPIEGRENIILVLHETSRTGAPILGWNIARGLVDHYNIYTATLRGGPLTDEFVALSVALYGPTGNHPVDIEFGLRSMLNGKSFKYAIVNSAVSILAIEALAKRRIPVVFLVHEFGTFVHPPEALRAAFDMSAEIVFPARLVAESSYKVHPPLRDRTIRIMPQGMSSVPAGTDSVQYTPPPVLETLQRARQAGTFFVVGAGTVDFRKGVDIFITTALAVKRGDAGRDVHFLWVGEGFRPEVPSVYSTFLHEQLERSGLQDHVTVLEAVPDLEPIYALADVLLLTSRLDPLPNVSIDAAHRGIPIVCFRNASGIADILLSDPETACGVVDHLVPGAAADAILALARNPENYNRGAVAIRSLARSTFDMATYVEALDALGTAAALAATRPDRNENSICHDIEAGHSAVLCK